MNAGRHWTTRGMEPFKGTAAATVRRCPRASSDAKRKQMQMLMQMQMPMQTPVGSHHNDALGSPAFGDRAWASS